MKAEFEALAAPAASHADESEAAEGDGEAAHETDDEEDQKKPPNAAAAC